MYSQTENIKSQLPKLFLNKSLKLQKREGRELDKCTENEEMKMNPCAPCFFF